MVALVAAPLHAQSVKAGIDEWQRGNYANAVAIWSPLADSGDADAQFNLGQAYRLGRGFPTNIAESQKWFERAAAQGHVDAETTLGLLLFQNGDQAGGLKWLKLAADQHEPRAMLVYGTALYNGDGVTQNPVLGYAFVSRAAAKGLAPAKDTLAQLDKIMSAEDRKKGAALAETMNKAAGSATFASTKSPKSAKPAKPAKPLETAAAKPPVEKPSKANAAAKPTQPVETASVEPPKKAPPKPTVKPAAKPDTAPAASEPPPVAASGAWRIQLGAFSQRGNAEALYRKVSGHGALAGRKPFYVAAGAVTRLQIGPFASHAAAQAACGELKGQACFPVAAQ
jgi:cell division septation protein DedD